ncbi:MAG: DUF4358 domain-containing protein [Clostridiales Family XIII bacterium]|jgi:hypothetical protein|nr:DUF4358 domain-containing protein [Clostridiales Family XIII bacterium]
MKKRIFTIIMALLAVFLFAGCGGGSGSGGGAGLDDGLGSGTTAQTDTLSGDTGGIISQLFNDADAEIPATFQDEVTEESAQGLIGLTADEFKKYVAQASVSTAAINAQAFEVALIKAADAGAAGEVAALVAKGFDSGKWICVFPEQSLTSVSGSYVLLAVGGKEQTDALAAAFKSLAQDNATAPNVFYEKPADSGDGGGGGLLLG